MEGTPELRACSPAGVQLNDARTRIPQAATFLFRIVSNLVCQVVELNVATVQKRQPAGAPQNRAADL